MIDESEECDYIWCGMIEKDTYDNIMNLLEKVPVVKVDKDNPQ